MAKKRAAKKEDIGELVDLLKAHPRLVRALIFDHEKVRRLLKSPAARRLLPGVNAGTAVVRGTIEGTDSGPPNPLVIFRCLRRSI
jgi:hypothetical protein